VAEVLEEHLRQSGLPPDSGHSEPFAVVKVGPLPYPIPNTRSGKRAVLIHDLNHLASGYRTDREGELEISAWELASGGCGIYGAAWVLDLAGLFAGLFVCRTRTAGAFRRGRSQRNLYPHAPDDLLAMDIDEARALTAAAPAGRLVRLPSPVHLAVLTLAAVPVFVAMSVAWWFLYPAWLLTRHRAPARRAVPCRPPEAASPPARLRPGSGRPNRGGRRGTGSVRSGPRRMGATAHRTHLGEAPWRPKPPSCGSATPTGA
jgi:hypothetical protein